MSRWSILCGVTLLMGLSACQTLAASQAATLDLDNPTTRAVVTSTLASAVSRARVELGPTDGPETAVVTVLPPPPGPLEANSTAVPVRFDIELRGGVCFAVRHDTGKAYLLRGIACKPVA